MNENNRHINHLEQRQQKAICQTGCILNNEDDYDAQQQCKADCNDE